MKLSTTSLLFLSLKATLLLCGSASAEEPVAVDEASEPIPKLPVKSEGCDLEKPKLLAVPGGPSKRLKLGERHLRLSLPKNYDPKVPAPMIVAYHDFNSTALEFEESTMLSHQAYNKDAIVIYPEASKDGRWISDASPPKDIDDIDFTIKLLNRMEANLCVDKDRIYATGLGTGAGLVHLVACNAELSTRLAAYALVNVNVFAGFESKDGRLDIKDKQTILWEKCRPQRLPARLLEIHTENNTLFDYWADKKVEDRKRVSVVRWLVEWAQQNKCGMALEMPREWASHKTMYKTLLERGYIFEGFIENGLVTKASYHCWAGDQSGDTTDETDDLIGKESTESDTDPQVAEESNTDSVETEDTTNKSSAESVDGKATNEVDTKAEDKKEDKTEPKDEVDPEEKKRLETEEFVSQLRHNMILEHYYVRGFPHGWPRVYSLKPKDEDGNYSTARIDVPDWKDIGTPDPEPGIDFSKDAFTFLFGYNSTSNVSGIIEFDSTVRVLDWFRMFRLSDDPPKPTRNSEGLTEFESDTLDKLMKDLEKSMAENPEPASDVLTQPGKVDDVPTSDDTVPVEREFLPDVMAELPKEDISQKSASREKDEL